MDGLSTRSARTPTAAPETGAIPRAASPTFNRARFQKSLRVAMVALLLLSSLPPTPAATQATAKVTASLDRATISAGESGQLALTFEAGNPDTAPAIPAIQGLSVRYSGSSSQFTFSNGRTSSTTSYNYVISAAQPGKYTIPAIRVVVSGISGATQPLTLTVLKGEAPPPGQDNQAYLKLIVAKPSVYVGESFPFELQLYFQAGQDIQMPKLPGDGFTIGTLPQPKQSRTLIGNVAYTVLSFRAAATPLKTGKLSLGPAECTMVVRVAQPGRRGNDPFDMFGDLFGPRSELRPITLQSNPINLEVLALPESNRPQSFGGAVGSFTLGVTANPTNLSVGDPITLSIRLAGEGGFDALSIPSAGDWRDFKTYPPTSRVELTDDLGLAGTKTFEWVVVPQNSEIKQVPPVEFSYFDPSAKSFKTLRSTPIPVTVHPSTTPQTPVVAKAGALSPPPKPARDLVHIKPNLGELTATAIPLTQRGWFLALNGIPVAFWLLALGWRKRSEAIARNPLLQRRTRTTKLVREGLQSLRAHAAADRSEDFFATLFRLLQEQIGSTLDLPASAITEAVVHERLGSGIAPPELLEELHSLFAVCNQARYAPHHDPQELVSLVPRIEAALRALDELGKTAATGGK